MAWLPDRFVLWLLATVVLGLAAPVSGEWLEAVDLLTLAAIFTLFLLHGARLPREALIAGLVDWRLHLTILAISFALFPLAGLLLWSLFPGLLQPEIWAGLLFLCALPSTVQSSIAYTSMAGGEVAGAVAAAAFSNLAGVFLTPLLVALMLQTQGAAFDPAGVLRIFALLFLPFVLGHLLRPLLRRPIEHWPKLVLTVDKGTILLAVYGAFSAATLAGAWSRLPPTELLLLAAVLALLLGFILLASWTSSGWAGFDDRRRKAILFCGSVKSLASGVPMARILFPGAAAGSIILPIMFYHTIQLIVCAWIAGAFAARIRERENGRG